MPCSGPINKPMRHAGPSPTGLNGAVTQQGETGREGIGRFGAVVAGLSVLQPTYQISQL